MIDTSEQHPVGVVDGERLRDHAAHRGAGDVRLLDAEVVEEPDRVVGHVDSVYGGRRWRAANPRMHVGVGARGRAAVDWPTSRLSKRMT